MDTFFRERDKISAPRERGDRLKISNKDGSPYNIEKTKNNLYKINENAAERCVNFLKLLEKHTKWSYNAGNWNFNNFRLMKFTKSDFKSKNWTIKKENWKSFLGTNPLSWAMTSGDNIEFTNENPDKLI